MSPELDQYIVDNSIPESDLLRELYRETHLYSMHPRMASGHIQGRFLSFISKLVAPKRILEIGAFTGYSALCLAEGLPNNGKLISIEIDDELESRLLKYFNRSDYKDQINLIIGSAIDVLPTLNEKFDLVFIDGDKREYSDYLKLIKPMLNSAAVVISDNVLWDGKVVEPVKPNDKMTQAVIDFNIEVQNDPDFENFILPVRDGLSIARFIG